MDPKISGREVSDLRGFCSRSTCGNAKGASEDGSEGAPPGNVPRTMLSWESPPLPWAGEGTGLDLLSCRSPYPTVVPPVPVKSIFSHSTVQSAQRTPLPSCNAMQITR